MTTRTLLDFENAILDLFENNRITVQDAKIVLWTLLTAIYEDELIEEPKRRDTIVENIERQKELLLVNVLGPQNYPLITPDVVCLAHMSSIGFIQRVNQPL